MHQAEKDSIIIEGLKMFQQEREEGKKLSQDVFDTYCQATLTVPIEIIPVTSTGKVLMFRREPGDTFFPNMWHTPGSIQLPRETIKNVIDRILNQELVDFIKIGEPQFLGILEINKGESDSECTRQQEVSIVYVQKIEEIQRVNTEKVGFFPFNNIPRDTIPFQRTKLIPKVDKFLGDHKIEISYI